MFSGTLHPSTSIVTEIRCFLKQFPDDNRVAVAEAGAGPPLVALLASGTAFAKEDAAEALFNISLNADDQRRVLGGRTSRRQLSFP